MKISEYTGPRCPSCGGPLWREEGCRVCWLTWIPSAGIIDEDHADSGREVAVRLIVLERWCGREAEANAWCFYPLVEGAPDYRSDLDNEHRRVIEAIARPRAILEPGPEPGVFDNIRFLALVRLRLSEAWATDLDASHHDTEDGAAADARVGHTRREVDDMIARICPPESRRPPAWAIVSSEGYAYAQPVVSRSRVSLTFRNYGPEEKA